MLTSKMSRKQKLVERGGEDGNEIWDMGSSLYDSYELASLCQILDRHIGAEDVLPSLHGEPRQEGLAGAPSPSPSPVPSASGEVVAFRGAHRGRAGRKVTLRALFRAAASWATRPRKADGDACVGAAPSGAIEPVASPGRVQDR
ncbi:hypothetical protein E2562_006404 [Oryza meyeriana var. granulata]|uniref:Uncharacterized protein n=1 Tax=Oryza meyeriana var. granulata TaxID=110450 RepID=A0A6G1EFD2_9ORYZ|nr:hypothetical protein E2562_006404 [Oryza meyeriana var. granulata]